VLEIGDYNIHLLEFVLIPWAIIKAPALARLEITLSAAGRYLTFYVIASLALLASVAVSSVDAVNPNAVWVRGFLKWLEIIGLNVVVFLACRSAADVRRFWKLLILACALSGVSLFFLDFVRPLLTGEYASWAENHVALMALRRLPGNDALLVFSLVFPFSKGSRSLRWLSATMIAVCLFSMSRTIWAALLVIALYVLIQDRGLRSQKHWIWIGAVVVALGVVLVTALLGYDVGEILAERAGELSSFETRSNLAVLAWEIFMEYPLTGIGAENFAEQLMKGLDFPEGHGFTENLTPHSVFLQVAAEMGILGFCSFVLWLGTVAVIAFSCRTSFAGTPLNRALRLFLLAQFTVLTFGFLGVGARVEMGLFVGLVLTGLTKLNGENSFPPLMPGVPGGAGAGGGGEPKRPGPRVFHDGILEKR
jgi:O-antigen ligase